VKAFLYWSPRILAILFILFMSVFALDTLGEPQWYIGLFMHLIPSFILTFITVIAWKQERIGGILFLIAGCAMIAYFHSITLFLPVFAVGILFLIPQRHR